jgi:hypothetical protein
MCTLVGCAMFAAGRMPVTNFVGPSGSGKNRGCQGHGAGKAGQGERKLIAKHKGMQEECFRGQQFHMCWKPTLAVMPGQLGQHITVHSPALTGPSPQLVNHFSCIHDLTSKTGLLR